MNFKVVVNTTPIIALGKIELLSVLRELYGNVTIPIAVVLEVAIKDDVAFHQLLENFDWIKIAECPEYEKNAFPKNLHAGEVEAIVLAQITNADFLIIDDNNARKTAKNLGLNVIGTAGTLLRAKELGIIPAVKPVLDSIRENNFYLSDRILDTVLRQAGEN